MKFGRSLIASVFVLSLLVGLCGCGNSSEPVSSEMSSTASTESMTSESSSAESSQGSEGEPLISPENVALMIENMLKDVEGLSVHVDHDSKGEAFNVLLAAPAFDKAAAILPISAEAADSWNELTETFKGLSDSCGETVEACGYPGAEISFSLANSTDNSDVYLKIINGEVTYNMADGLSSSGRTPVSASSSASSKPASSASSEASKMPKPSKSETTSQRQAIRKAREYLNFTSFSRTGLISQLEYEGFSTDDATYAVDAIDVDWNKQAAEKAQQYLDYASFSRQKLIDQLIYEGFTQNQAIYGVDSVGL